MTVEQQEEARYFSTSFKMFPEKVAAQGRSLSLLLLHRRCASCWGSLIQEASGGLEIGAEEHMERIASHCSKTPDFINTGLPIMEAIFRILLGYSNQGATLEEIYDTLQERWSDPTNAWMPTPDKLYRMLSRDTFYGIGEVPGPEEGEAS